MKAALTRHLCGTFLNDIAALRILRLRAPLRGGVKTAAVFHKSGLGMRCSS